MSRSHVKFAVDTNLEPGHIHLEQKGDIVEAHIGLLKNHHTYSAEIPIAHSLGCNVIAQHPQHNIYIRVSDLSETVVLERDTGTGQFSSTVTVFVRTIKEGNIAESIELVSEEDPTQLMSVLITAKVLHGSQGNPLLKNGVHILSHEHQNESDYTEWPGHGRDSDPEIED